MKFVDELKRRNVIKATIAYIVVAWVLLQFITIVLPNFETPPWVLKTLMFLMAIGLPIWIIFSWVYEVTPEGIKRTAKVPKDQSITAATNKRLNIIIIITLIIAIAVSFINKPLPSTALKAITNTNLVMENSIAVIPFKNLSDNRENQYFADGVMDDILNHLSSIQAMEVKSRQSSERYRDSDKSIVQIGTELGANYLLEGSVQKHNDSIRIIVQLIDAINDNHLWSHKYDSELKNVFAIQSEISKQIANELNAVISPFETEQIEKTPTVDLEAYNLYLKGRFFWHRRHEEDLYKSIDYYNQALKLDSTYALAYAGLADSYYMMAWHGSISQNEAFRKGRMFAQKALKIDKTIAEAYATLGGIANWHDWNWQDAERKIKYAISLNPNYASAYQWYAELLDVLGRNKEALLQIEKALELNPNSYMMHATRAMLNVKEGNFEKAIIDADRAKDIDKNLGWAYWIKFESLWNQGKNDEAIAEMVEWWTIEPNLEMAKGSREAYDKWGIKGVYKYIIDYDLQKGFADDQPRLMAEKYAFIGENEKALDWLEKAYNKRGLEIPLINNNPYFKNIRSEPRFMAILDKLGLTDN